jgi:hypothetical protein
VRPEELVGADGHQVAVEVVDVEAAVRSEVDRVHEHQRVRSALANNAGRFQ